MGFHLHFVFMAGPSSRQVSPSWCGTFSRRALHGPWVVSARCWTRPCFWGLGANASKVPVAPQPPLVAMVLGRRERGIEGRREREGEIDGAGIFRQFPRFPVLQPSFQAGIWDWLQEEAPQMLPSLLQLVRQALPPAPAAAWHGRMICFAIGLAPEDFLGVKAI